MNLPEVLVRKLKQAQEKQTPHYRGRDQPLGKRPCESVLCWALPRTGSIVILSTTLAGEAFKSANTKGLER